MARISTYNRDFDVGDYDAWIGTDSPTGFTKQFTAAAVAEYLNIKGKMSISAQMSFKYVTNNQGPGCFIGPANGLAMTAITTMQLSKTDVSSQNVVGFMDYLVGSNMLVSQQNAISTFGHFLIDSYTINDPDDGFYTLNLTNIGGNGKLTDLLYYDFAVFTPSSSVGDKNFVYPQDQAANPWVIQHNLNKFPSCTMVLSTGQQGFGDVTFIDENNLTITFASAETGKAYIN